MHGAGGVHRGGVHGRGCMLEGRMWGVCAWCGGGVYIAGGAWQGMCVVLGACMVGMCMAGVCVVLGACIVGGMCGRGACVGGDVHDRGVNERAVHILLEYILVITFAES